MQQAEEEDRKKNNKCNNSKSFARRYAYAGYLAAPVTVGVGSPSGTTRAGP
jgi:hypothetical protein